MLSLTHAVLVLVRTEGALNLGSVARLCDNFGCQLRLVAPIAHPMSEEATMMAYPSEQILREAPQFDTLAAAISDIPSVLGTSSKIVEAVKSPPLTPALASAWLREADCKIAIVFGNERLGLTREESLLCHRVVRLVTTGSRDSMNLSHAIAATLQVFALAVSAHETSDSSQRTAVAPPGAPADRSQPSASCPPSIGPVARERLLETWLDTLQQAHYFRNQTPVHFARRLRPLIDKMQLDERDLKLMEGMLRSLRKSESHNP